MDEPQVWVLIGVCAAAMFGMIGEMSARCTATRSASTATDAA